MPVRRVVAGGAAALLAAALAGCGSGSSSGSAGPTTQSAASSPSTSTPSTSTSAGPTTAGTPRHPVRPSTREEHLRWSAVPGPIQDLTTVSGPWRLTVVDGGRRARLTGPRPRTITAGAHAEISDAYLDAHHALVVTEDKLARTPDIATLVYLATGRTTTLDRSSSPATSVGGTWALGPDALVHATYGPGHRYCLATVDLGTGAGSTGPCVPPRHGFSRAAVTPDGTSMMAFDAHRPSCRTLVRVTGAHLTPLPGVAPCLGWDSALLGGGAVWSVIPDEHQIDVAHFYARTGNGWYDLGRGTSGTLVVCGGAAYFARDPGSARDPATLLRWNPADAALATVFASRGHGHAFLSAPRCGGDHLTVTAYSAAGDEQVTARVG